MRRLFTMTFVEPDGTARRVEAPEGMSVLEIGQTNGYDLEGACEGCMACSTCHVIVDGDWLDRLEPACEEEEDILDLAFGLTPTSRLGCQITITEGLDGLIVSIPAEHLNLQK